VPEEVRLNALAELHEFIVRNDLKMRENIAEIEDDEVKSSMNQVLDSIVSKYGEGKGHVKYDVSKSFKRIRHIFDKTGPIQGSQHYLTCPLHFMAIYQPFRHVLVPARSKNM
jgi:hypothetical protein